MPIQNVSQEVEVDVNVDGAVILNTPSVLNLMTPEAATNLGVMLIQAAYEASNMRGEGEFDNITHDEFMASLSIGKRGEKKDEH